MYRLSDGSLKRGSYLLWSAPEFFGTPRSQWSKSEATAYLEEVRQAMIPRSNYLRAFFDVDESLDAVSQLREAQARAQILLRNSPFSITVFDPGATPLHVEEQLTLEGESVAIDLGLLLAKLLLGEFPERIHWSIGAKPKSDINYNLPVLAGVIRQAGPNVFNPIGFALGRCTAALTDPTLNDALAQVFEHISRELLKSQA